VTTEAQRCLDDEQVAELLEGAAAPGALAAAEDHAATCDACRELLAVAAKICAADRNARAAEPTAPGPGAITANGALAEPSLPEHLGDTIGRYRIEEVVGRGGMGIVYAAKDDTLRRTVALKLLTRSVLGDDGRSRVLREARAMASIDHPNVLSVHDVGVHDDLVYIVMDLVDGGDLRRWLREHSLPWREVLAVYVAAGRGLAAIHRVGLVHRDFKPANVLVGRDGRVQITDFGLVGGAGTRHRRPDSSTVRGVLGDDRTETGMLLGTPRYMSPEQIRGDAVDALSDQFAFCVALWESVTGQHPFGSGALVDRITRMKEGPPSESSGPPELLNVLRRGLSPVADQRFDSMDTLLAALERAAELRRRRRRITVASLALLGAVGIGMELGDSEPGDPCPSTPHDDFAGVWDEGTRTTLREALTTSEEHPQWLRFAELIDTYTTQWGDAQREACIDTHVRGEVSEDMLDRRTACLHRARSGLDAVVRVIESSPVGEAPDLVGLALQLPDLDGCRDLAALASVAPRPTDEQTAAAVDALDAENVAAATLAFAGRLDEARARVDSAMERARGLGWAPLTAALLNRSALLTARTDPAAAVSEWRQAYVLAASAGHLVAFEVGVDGVHLLAAADRVDEAAFILDITAGHAQALGGEPRPGETSNVRALLARLAGDFAAAERHTRDELAARVGADDRAGQARALSNLSGLLGASGRAEEALEVGAQAFRASEEAYGPRHPQTISSLYNLAYVHYVLGHYARSRAMAQDCLAWLEPLDAPRDHARTLNLLADLAHAQGDFDDALEHLDAALRLASDARAPFGQPAYIRSRIGEVMLDAGRLEDAIAELERATQEVGDSGMEAVNLADTYANLSLAYGQVDNDTAQMEAATRAYEIGRELTDHHGGLAFKAYANALDKQGRRSEARRVLDRAVAMVEPLGDAAPRYQAMILLDRAELLSADGDVDGAREDVDRARAMLDAAGDRDNPQWTRAEAWRASHPARTTD